MDRKLAPDSSDSSPPTVQMIPQGRGARRCSRCGGYVRPDAVSCKHCGAIFPEQPARTPARAREGLWILLTLAAAVGGGWWASQLLSGIAAVALGWTVGTTILAVGLLARPMRDRVGEDRDTPIWQTIAIVWLCLLAILALPATIGAAAMQVGGGLRGPIGLSVFVTLVCVMLALLIDVLPSSRRSSKADASAANGPSLWREIGRLWLQLHLVLVLPALLQSWLGPDATPFALLIVLGFALMQRTPDGEKLFRRLARRIRSLRAP